MILTEVLAELDGTGVPLAYLFISRVASNGPTESGAMTQILTRFLRNSLHSGFAPSFVECDKDWSEISAAQQIWLIAKSPALLLACQTCHQDESDVIHRN